MNEDWIKGKAETGFGRVESAYGRWAADDDLILEGDARQAGGRARELYGQTKDGLQDAVDRVLGSTEAAYEASRRQLQEGAVRLNAQVERSPAMAILVAATAGYVLAMLFRGRRR